MTRHPILGTADKRDVLIDVDRLVASRLLLQANSGAGKSWALRRLLEQTHGKVQQIVIDPEGEFHTLRERFDYVLASPQGGDCIASPQTAKLLARRLLELHVSAILDIYELRAHDRVRFVRAFLEALVNAPRALWHPVLVVVDEVHIFCPQTGSAESLGAVIDLMTRGRKRGYCGVIATQRISKLHKDAAAEANNKLIGRSALDVDMRRAGDELGFSTKGEQHQLRTLAPGEFFAFGPALCGEVTKLLVGPVTTTHPRAGQTAPPPTAPTEAIKAALAQLADLPKEAEEEAQTVDALRAKNRDLERQLRQRPKEGPSEAEITERERAAWGDGKSSGLADAADMLAAIVRGEIDTLQDRLLTALSTFKMDAIKGGAATQVARSSRIPKPAPQVKPTVRPERTVQAPPPSEGLTGPEQRILDAVAWFETIGIDRPSRLQVAFVAGYKPGGGAFGNPLGRLRTAGLLEKATDGSVPFTDEGRRLARFPSSPGTTADLHAMILTRLNGPQRRILQPALDAYPGSISRSDLAALAGYEPTGGAFGNPLGSLRTLGLLDYPQPGQVRATDICFVRRG